MGWGKVLEIVAQYGPFPVGIVFGIMIKRWAVKFYIRSVEREKDALRAEKKELIELVKAKEERIDALHERLNK